MAGRSWVLVNGVSQEQRRDRETRRVEIKGMREQSHQGGLHWRGSPDPIWPSVKSQGTPGAKEAWQIGLRLPVGPHQCFVIPETSR